MNFKDFPLKISYTSLKNDSLSFAMNALLPCAKFYRRSVGFFSSTALDFIGEGLLQMSENGGKIFLATSPHLSQSDILAIREGYAQRGRDILQERFLQEARETLKNLPFESARLLYRLVKSGAFEIKIVARKNGIYHDKLALLEDFDGNVVAFVGSNNETGAAYESNYEKTRVYKSWTDSEGRIADESQEFLQIWSGKNPELFVCDFMQAFENELLQKISQEKNENEIHPKTKYEIRSYQKEANENWILKGRTGFFVMATGTGKTIAALNAIKDFVFKEKIFTVIAAPYKHLVSQWKKCAEDFLFEKNCNAKIFEVHGEINEADGKIFRAYARTQKNYFPIIVVTTIKSFFLERYEKLYERIHFEKLLVVDEAHNFANKFSDGLSKKYKYKLGLSATPSFGNKEKTKTLLDWFGGVAINLPLEKALGKFLANYNYFPFFVNATEDDENAFKKAQGAMMAAMKNGKIEDAKKFAKARRAALRSISMASEKQSRICEIFSAVKESDHVIIYCSDGKLFEKNEKRHLEEILTLINEGALKTKGKIASKFTAQEKNSERLSLINSFENGTIEYLAAIRCLDEGVDIPSIKAALILSSGDSVREFVQRRGRILRKSYGKEIASIYDVVVLPSEKTRGIAKIELRRYYEYSRLALNKNELLKKMNWLLKKYDFSLDDIKFEDFDFAIEGELDE